jgi:hypothetical protein
MSIHFNVNKCARMGLCTVVALLIISFAAVAGTNKAVAAPAVTPVAAGHTIAAAKSLSAPDEGSGGGGPIDFWKVSLTGGDDLEFNLNYDGASYEYALYPPGTTDANFTGITPVDSENTMYYGAARGSVNLQAPYTGTYVVAVCENVADGNCANVEAGSGTDPMAAYTFAATWLNHVTAAHAARETKVSTTIKGAKVMPLGNYESGGGGPIDFWKVSLQRGDQVQFNLNYNQSEYEFALYSPKVTDANFGNATAVTSVGTMYYGIAESSVSLTAPSTGTFVLAVCENVADGNCGNVVAGSGTNPMDEYTFTTARTGGLESGTVLGLSASAVKYGSEKSLKLSVKVVSAYGNPVTGKVGISDGKKTICVVKLSGGKGSCHLAGGKLLGVGKYSLVAYYGGNLLASKSSAKVLTVKK